MLFRRFRRRTRRAPVTGTLVGLRAGYRGLDIEENRGLVIYERTDPDILLIDVYPFRNDNPKGDFIMNNYFFDLDFVDYIRAYTDLKWELGRTDDPFWIILQTHGDTSASPVRREPYVEELRAMNWMSLGEGAHRDLLLPLDE